MNGEIELHLVVYDLCVLGEVIVVWLDMMRAASLSLKKTLLNYICCR